MARLARFHPMIYTARQPSLEPIHDRPSWLSVWLLCACCLFVGATGGLMLDASRLEDAHREVDRARQILSEIGTDDPAPLPTP